MFNGHAFGQSKQSAGHAVLTHRLVFFRLVGDDDDALGTFSPHALCDLNHAMAFGAFTDRLTAGHSNCIVVQNFVGDVHACGDTLAHRQNAAVEIGAVANVGEDVLVIAERLLAYPGHALAAHLREAGGAAVHPQRHEMATDTCHGA